MAVETRRIVVYGGTFDPFHSGHLAVARYLRDELNPDQVLIVPAGNPWLRQHRPAATPIARLTMCKLATANEPGIEVSDVDIRRGGDTYSIDTINDLRLSCPDATDFSLAIGSDSLGSLHKWHRIDELLQQCKLAVVHRPGQPTPNADDIPTNATLLGGPNIDIDATKIRRIYSDGDYATAARMVPSPVHRYIISEELYWCVPTK